MINTVIKDCTNDIYIPVMIWDIFAVLHLIIGYFTIRKIIEKSWLIYINQKHFCLI